MPALAQTRVTLSGTVKDARTSESLTGATVRIVELPGVGTGADAAGAFTLTLPANSSHRQPAAGAAVECRRAGAQRGSRDGAAYRG